MKILTLLMLSVLPFQVFANYTDKYTVVFESDSYTAYYKILKGKNSGKCYLDKYRSFTEVDCSDYIKQEYDKSGDKLQDFLDNNCSPPKKGYTGRVFMQCEVSEDYLERREYLKMKAKFEEK